MIPSPCSLGATLLGLNGPQLINGFSDDVDNSSQPKGKVKRFPPSLGSDIGDTRESVHTSNIFELVLD